MTKAQVQALIDSNLASGTAITAILHREVETEILNYADSAIVLSPMIKGTLTFGDIYSGHDSATITFADLGTTSYIVLGTIFSKLTGNVAGDEITFVIKNKTATSFDVYFREGQSVVQNFDFDYIIFKK